ncbi:hypothetical protein AB0L57_15665 [Nocardia sp. NPDC052254]|uniref:hypothetical protein n=1 Tax=Nocardia sp. NPDC052254 TaxID=3155681 RepID=UPI0034380F06
MNMQLRANFFRRTAIAVALAAPLSLGAAATVSAQPATVFPVPVVTGPEIGPGGVPGGLFQTTSVTATPGDRPGTVIFSVATPAPYNTQYNYRWLTVQWRNLRTGATGAADLRHWVDTGNTVDKSYAATLPLQVTADTGSGPVVATVAHEREQYNAPPQSTAVVPGFGAIMVP